MDDAQEGASVARLTADGRAGSRPGAPYAWGIAAVVSVASAAVMAALSVAGLAYPDVYPQGAREAFVPNDAVNLVLGVPALLAVTWWGSRGSLLATLAWPGALGYVAYNYTAYLFGLPVGWLSALALSLVCLSVWATAAILGRMDARGVRDRLAGAVPIRFGGWVVAVIGVAFAARGAAMLAGGRPLTRPEVGVLVADVIVSAVWAVVGVAMVRRRPLGYVAGMAVLTSANLLFAGLLALLLVQPVVTGAQLAAADMVVVAAMWPVTLVPGVLFARGVASRVRADALVVEPGERLRR